MGARPLEEVNGAASRELRLTVGVADFQLTRWLALPLSALIALAAACGSPEPARHPAPEVAVPRGSPAAKTPARAGDELTYNFAERYPSSRTVTAETWANEHAARGPVSEKECWDLGPTVGVPGAPGLLCVSSSSAPPEKLARIYRVENGRLQSVWQATVGTHANWLELVPVLDVAGVTLILHERRAGDCERALCQYSEKVAHGVEMDFGAVLRRGCQQRGAYAYRDGKFVQEAGIERARPPLPSVLGGSGCGD